MLFLYNPTYGPLFSQFFLSMHRSVKGDINWLVETGDRYFVISKTTEIREGFYFAHPFLTEINTRVLVETFCVETILQ